MDFYFTYILRLHEIIKNIAKRSLIGRLSADHENGLENAT